MSFTRQTEVVATRCWARLLEAALRLLAKRRWEVRLTPYECGRRRGHLARYRDARLPFGAVWVEEYRGTCCDTEWSAASLGIGGYCVTLETCRGVD